MTEMLNQIEDMFQSYLKLNLKTFMKWTLSDWKDYHYDHGCSQLLGESENGIAIYGFKMGSGKKVVSLIAGCHADEPVGPLHLNMLLKFLEDFSSDDSIKSFLETYQLWIVPDVNPDGALVNEKWWREGYLKESSLASYLKNRVRELPGRDVEFGYPAMRPENKAVSSWWISQLNDFEAGKLQVISHVSLHGMGFSAGPWFLLEKAWDDANRLSLLKESLSESVLLRGFVPHDMERLGEKGFYRLGSGFCSRPDSLSMKKHFEEIENFAMAEKFEQSSMEYVRELFGDVFTCVSEMPLFILPDVGLELGPPDLASVLWKTRISQWELELSLDVPDETINESAKKLGLKAMSLEAQLFYQARLVYEAIRVAS